MMHVKEALRHFIYVNLMTVSSEFSRKLLCVPPGLFNCNLKLFLFLFVTRFLFKIKKVKNRMNKHSIFIHLTDFIAFFTGKRKLSPKYSLKNYSVERTMMGLAKCERIRIGLLTELMEV